MKKLVLLLACVFSIQVAMADHSKAVAFNQLPQKAQTFIKTHFPKEKVSFAKEERDFFDKEYKVVFVNGAKVEFAKDGAWKEVDCKYGEVPAAAVPRQIADEVARLFPACRIVSIERDRSEYEVKLDNGTELTFDRKFRLTDMDD